MTPLLLTHSPSFSTGHADRLGNLAAFRLTIAVGAVSQTKKRSAIEITVYLLIARLANFVFMARSRSVTVPHILRLDNQCNWQKP
ncbi:MAG TPA: hypothetical protein V6C50_09940 [Crinalium sp.]